MHPGLLVLAGAGAISFTGVLVRLADEPPAAAGLYRCLYALVLLGVLALVERRRLGGMERRRHALAATAGILFAVDLELWHHGIAAFGAGLSTVVSNLQVVVVGAAAWLVLGERPTARVGMAVPVALVGVVLISGVVGSGAYGDDPALGALYSVLTAVAYGGFLFVMRIANRDRRGAAGPLFWATAWAAAALALMGTGLDELSWPDPRSHLWLLALALSAQVVGYLTITTALPRLPAVVSSIILLAQPCVAVGLAALIVDERPSWIQLGGVALVVAGILVATMPSRSLRLGRQLRAG
jgi:drug/metabolite transporter (DMT)-like permease